MLKETIITIGMLLSIISSMYFIRCGFNSKHTTIDVEPVPIEEVEE